LRHHRVAKDVADFLFHAAPVALGAAFKAGFHVVFQAANDERDHGLLLAGANEMMMSNLRLLFRIQVAGKKSRGAYAGIDGAVTRIGWRYDLRRGGGASLFMWPVRQGTPIRAFMMLVMMSTPAASINTPPKKATARDARSSTAKR
jgi:hypothetical protein